MFSIFGPQYVANILGTSAEIGTKSAAAFVTVILYGFNY
jgi:hypothetical protein